MSRTMPTNEVDGVRVVALETRIADPADAAELAHEDTGAWTLQILPLTGIRPVHPGDELTGILTKALEPSPPSAGTCWWSRTRSSPRRKEGCHHLRRRRGVQAETGGV